MITSFEGGNEPDFDQDVALETYYSCVSPPSRSYARFSTPLTSSRLHFWSGGSGRDAKPGRNVAYRLHYRRDLCEESLDGALNQEKRMPQAFEPMSIFDSIRRLMRCICP